MKMLKRILILFIILALAYGGLLMNRARWNAYACVHQITRAYPYEGSPYHAEVDDEGCSDFGASASTSVRLVKPGFLGTKLWSKKVLYVFDGGENASEATLRWLKPDVLQVRVHPMPAYTLAPPVEEVDGIKIVYVFKKEQINDPPPTVNLKAKP